MTPFEILDNIGRGIITVLSLGCLTFFLLTIYRNEMK